MKKYQIIIILIAMLTLATLTSCKTIKVSGVAYQSMRLKNPVSENEVTSDATIIVYCYINELGALDVKIKNNTDVIMTIDRTKSFFRDGDNNAIPYYDPNIIANTQSTTQGNTAGTSVNMGAIANAVGIGGALGTALSGINVAETDSYSTTKSNTTYYIDQPELHIPPHSSASMGRLFNISGIGDSFLREALLKSTDNIHNNFTSDHTYASCNICISYSVDNGNSYETIITDIYANSILISKVKQKGKVNDALRVIYTNKDDVFAEPWFLMHFGSQAYNNDYRSENNYISNKYFITNYK